MEELVSFDAPSSHGDVLLHDLQGIVDGGEITRGPSLGSQRGELGLESLSRLDDLRELLGVPP
jgi:hypothetical protein